MALRLDTLYIPLSGEGSPRGTFGTMVEMILKSRLTLHLDEADPPRSSGEEESVNAYLAGLLVSYIDPAYLHAVQPFLSPYDVDLHQAVLQCGEDRVLAYRIYKANADDLLLSLGIFRRFLSEADSTLIRVRRYYTAAAGTQKRIYRQPTALSRIQDQLAEETRRYLAILTQARLDYLSFARQVAPDEWAEFEQKLTP